MLALATIETCAVITAAAAKAKPGKMNAVCKSKVTKYIAGRDNSEAPRVPKA
jgi:hypothetical protein